jgi:hypothetical protein
MNQPQPANSQRSAGEADRVSYKLRIKHPSGAEFEAEGPAEFIQSEKEGFLSRVAPAAEALEQANNQANSLSPEPWKALTEAQNGLLILKNKHHQLKAGDAALLLLAAARLVNKEESVTAISLAKAIRISGYVPERIDRLLTKAGREGMVKASGTKRNRAYQITDKGLERAWLEAQKLK